MSRVERPQPWSILNFRRSHPCPPASQCCPYITWDTRPRASQCCQPCPRPPHFVFPPMLPSTLTWGSGGRRSPLCVNIDMGDRGAVDTPWACKVKYRPVRMPRWSNFVSEGISILNPIPLQLRSILRMSDWSRTPIAPRALPTLRRTFSHSPHQ